MSHINEIGVAYARDSLLVDYQKQDKLIEKGQVLFCHRLDVKMWTNIKKILVSKMSELCWRYEKNLLP